MKPSSSPSIYPEDINSDNSQIELPLKLKKLCDELNASGFPAPVILSINPTKIQLPYKNGSNSVDNRQVLTRILDSCFYNWSCSTEYQGQNYLISG